MKKWAVAAVAIALLAAGYLASPYWPGHLMRSATEFGEGNRAGQYFDFPSARESFETQAAAMISQPMQSGETTNNPFAALGQKLAVEAMESHSEGPAASALTPPPLLTTQPESFQKPPR